MNTKVNLNNINSQYVLKLVFLYSNLKYKSILKLIKYNKSLQNKLGIIFDYKKYFNYKYIIEHKLVLLPPIFQIINFGFIFIYFLIAAAEGTFNEKNTKINYDKSKKKFIANANKSLYGYLGFLLIQIIILSAENKNCPFSLKIIFRNKIYFFIIYAFILLLDLCFVIIYCIKINFSFKIIVSDFENWFIIFDIIIIISLSLQNLFNILFFIKSLAYKKYILTQFKYINIEEYELDKKFGNLDINGKNDFIFNKSKDYKYKLNSEQIDLINLINNIRKEHKLKKLDYSLEENLPDFIINEYPDENKEIILDKIKNIFKISTNKYLFRYSKGQFKNNLNDKNPEIINIILKESLNRIIIIEQNNIEFILISGNLPNSSYKYQDIKINVNYDAFNSEKETINNITNNNIDI